MLFSFDVGRSMFDVGRSSFPTSVFSNIVVGFLVFFAQDLIGNALNLLDRHLSPVKRL